MEVNFRIVVELLVYQLQISLLIVIGVWVGESDLGELVLLSLDLYEDFCL